MMTPLTGGQIWRWPLALAITSAIGLISALLEDGVWDMVSWVTLSAPVAVILWHMWPLWRGQSHRPPDC
ncbi:MAG: hypothetical protein AB7T38_04905 [Nitrospirales bacterium]